MAELVALTDELNISDTGIINFNPTDSQANVITLTDGSHVVTWTRALSDGEIVAQRFTSDWMAVGGVFTINPVQLGYQYAPTLAAMPGGGFVVVWTSSNSNGTSGDILARTYPADPELAPSDPITINVGVNTFGGDQLSVAALPGGGFAVTWNLGSAIYAQIVDALGERLPADITVALGNDTRAPAIAATEDGGFAIAWRNGSQQGVVQYFDPAGQAVGSPFLIAGADQITIVAGLGSDDLFLAWQDPQTLQILGQHVAFDSGSVVALTPAIQLSSGTISNYPSLYPVDGGGVVAVWMELNGGNFDVVARQFSGNLEPMSDVTPIAQGPNGQQIADSGPTMTIDANGELAVVWDDQDIRDIFVRHFALNVTPPANNPPIANADTATAIEAGVAAGADATGNVLANDTDPDTGDMNLVSAVIFGTTPGTVGSGLAGTYGTLTLNADGSYGYVVDNTDPAVNALRLSTDTLTETFSYTMRDSAGAESSSSLTITIHGANDAPLAVGEVWGGFTAGEDFAGTVSYPTLFNDSDPDLGDSLTIVALDATGLQGSMTIAGNGLALNYTANPSAFQYLSVGQSALETANYTIRDLAGATSTATMSILIEGRNDAPNGIDSTITVTEDTPRSFTAADFGFSDIDATDTLFAVYIGAPSAGRLVYQGNIFPDGGYIPVSELHNLTYEPPANASGVELATLSFKVVDSSGSATRIDNTAATLTIDVTPVNDAPTVQIPITDRTWVEDLGGPNPIVQFGFSENTFADLDGDALTYSATLVDGSALPTWLTFDAPNRTFSAALPLNFNGVVSITVTASDGNLSISDTFNFTVAPVNDAPTANPDTATAIEAGVAAGADATGNVLANDTDPDTGDMNLVSAVTFGATPGTVGSGLVGAYGTLTLNADGSYGYIIDNANPLVNALQAGQTLTETFSYTMRDGTGAGSTATLVFTIQGTNDAALIAGATSGTVQEAALLGGAGAIIEGKLTISDVDSPAQFVAANIAGLYGTFVLTTAGDWGYVLDNSLAVVDGLSNGESLTEFFTANAADGTAQTVTVTIAGSDDIRTGTSQSQTLTGTSGNDTLRGLGGNDTLIGGLGNDILDGGTGSDWAYYSDLASGVSVSLVIAGPQNTGGGGFDTLIGIERLSGSQWNDVLAGNAEANVIFGNRGDDLIDGGGGNDSLGGGEGIDTVSYASAMAGVMVNLSNTSSQNTVGAGNDTLDSFENLIGSAFGDQLSGTAGANRIEGGAGIDRILGRGGADLLAGGNGDDIFAYDTLLESNGAARDVIIDFEGAGSVSGDVIDLSRIDAIVGGRNDAFTFIGTAAFSGTAGQLRYDTTSSPGFTLVEADVNGDRVSDFQLLLQWQDSQTPISLVGQDFIL